MAASGGFRARASKGSGQEERSELGPMCRKGTRTLEAFGRGPTRGFRAHVPDPGSDVALAAPHAGTSGCCGGGTQLLQSSGERWSGRDVRRA